MKNRLALLFGSLTLGIISLGVFVVLRQGGVWNKLHSFGEGFFWTGFITGAFFGAFWGVFVAGGSIAKQVSTSFKIPEAELSYLYSLISEVLTNFTVIVETFCFTMLVIGLASWITSRIFIKRTVQENVKAEGAVVA